MKISWIYFLIIENSGSLVEHLYTLNIICIIQYVCVMLIRLWLARTRSIARLHVIKYFLKNIAIGFDALYNQQLEVILKLLRVCGLLATTACGRLVETTEKMRKLNKILLFIWRATLTIKTPKDILIKIF